MKRTFIHLCCLIQVILVGSLLCSCLRQEPPVINVSIRECRVSGEYAELKWVVKNRSEHRVTFDENCVAQLTVNGSSKLWPTEAVELAPGEELELLIELYGLDPSGINTLKITAASNEGTTAAYSCTIEAPE